MQLPEKLLKFRQLIHNKYLIYNSLFLQLPNTSTAYTGILIPLLHKLSKEGFERAAEPKEVIEAFFRKHGDFEEKPEKQLDLLFRMIQYIERQVLLFDCVEDAAFTAFQQSQLPRLLSPGHKHSQELKEHLCKFSTRIVFTAHPTQFYSHDAQRIMHKLRKAIAKDNTEAIDILLQQLSYTPFVNREKPSPFDEAQNIIHYLRYVHYDAFGSLYRQIGEQIGAEPNFNPKLIELGFWPGGDRDGNPFVRAETTKAVAQLLRTTVMKCHYQQLKDLREKLSFRHITEPLDKLKDWLYTQIFEFDNSLRQEDILDVLYQVRQRLIGDYKSLFLEELDDFIGRVHLFGTHFASLDIRQDSSQHLKSIELIFQRAFGLDYQNLSQDERLDYLLNRPLKLRAEDYKDEPITADTIENIRQIASIQEANGEKGLHRYIISNSESIFDILHVYALFLYCGYSKDKICIDIVPLFETMQGMADSEDIMRQLYALPAYKEHLHRRGMRQDIMLGFSDGTKDGGYLKANMAIQETKARLTALSKEAALSVIFFDGRGGPPSRGGGKSHKFYAAQSSDIANEAIQLTIQGQTITSLYGTREQAAYNIEQLLLAGFRSQEQEKIGQDEEQLLAQLAEKSYEEYKELKADPLFTRYLEEMSTLPYYGQTNIGSRPSKRKQSAKLDLKDLRAIPFVGAWSLARQNVPGYYGLGTALESFADEPEKVQALYRKSAFFRCLIQHSVMSMKKSYFPLTAYMQEDPLYGPFWLKLRQEYLLSKKWALLLTKQEELMEHEPLSRRSISAREQIVLPLLCIQQYALQMIREGGENKEVFEKLLIRSLFGNINASRNSA